jgi:N-formylglutamate deformylase
MPYVVTSPRDGAVVPVFYSSPHSGRAYPNDWRTKATRAELRRGEDAYVDELLAGAGDAGIGLIAARFPRCYVDINRNEDDIDADLLIAPWSGPLRPTEKSRRGLGLIRRFVVPGIDINDGKIDPADVARRIETIHRPYHARLEAELAALHNRFGVVWLIDWHSMKSKGNAMTPDGEGAGRPDMIVGDLDGASADPQLTRFVVTTLRSLGYAVAVNNPYKGGLITARYGRPAEGRHAVQIEINRALYLDEMTVAKAAGFPRLAADIGEFTRRLAVQSIRA